MFSSTISLLFSLIVLVSIQHCPNSRPSSSSPHSPTACQLPSTPPVPGLLMLQTLIKPPVTSPKLVGPPIAGPVSSSGTHSSFVFISLFSSLTTVLSVIY